MTTSEVLHLQTLYFIPQLKETQIYLNCIFNLFSPRLSLELKVSSHCLPNLESVTWDV